MEEGRGGLGRRMMLILVVSSLTIQARIVWEVDEGQVINDGQEIRRAR